MDYGWTLFQVSIFVLFMVIFHVQDRYSAANKRRNERLEVLEVKRKRILIQLRQMQRRIVRLRKHNAVLIVTAQRNRLMEEYLNHVDPRWDHDYLMWLRFRAAESDPRQSSIITNLNVPR